MADPVNEDRITFLARLIYEVYGSSGFETSPYRDAWIARARDVLRKLDAADREGVYE